jgi:hypothetical protein
LSFGSNAGRIEVVKVNIGLSVVMPGEIDGGRPALGLCSDEEHQVPSWEIREEKR